MDCTTVSCDVVKWLRVAFSGDILRARNWEKHFEVELFRRPQHKKGRSTGVVDGVGALWQRLCVARGGVFMRV